MTTTAAEQVDIQLTDCEREDARAVCDALRDRFTTVVGSVGAPVPAPYGAPRPTVWTLEVDAASARGGGAPSAGSALAGPVTAVVSGCPEAVETVTGALAAAYPAERGETVYGDQETEVRMVLARAT